MKFKVIYNIDTETEQGSSAIGYVIDEDGKEIHELPKKEMIAIAFHLSRGASDILNKVFRQDYMEQ